MTQRFPGTGQGFTEGEPPAVLSSLDSSSELPIGSCLVELSLSLGTKDGQSEYQLSIEAPTFKGAYGILQAALVRLCATVSQDQSNGDS
jgi:hypothetical protein